MKRKLCYIIPEYRDDDSTHFSYLLDFVERISVELDIFLIVEKSNSRVPTALRIYQQKFSWLPLRWIENGVIIKYARFRGYRDFYVHYSFLSAFNSSVTTRIWGGRVFYWNCGLPWNYSQSVIRSFFERRVYSLITYLVTGTDSLKKEYSTQYHIPLEKIVVMPNWIDVKRWQVISDEWRVEEKKKALREKLTISPDTKILLFIHRLSKRKGAHYLPEIMNRLREENAILLVVGDGPEREFVKLKIENLKLEHKVSFLGNIPQKEVIQYFSIADIFIMPSKEEGFPHVLLEAMASGLPFVAFDVGGVREITPPETHQFLCSKGDIGSFVEGIRSLLYGDTLRAQTSSIEQHWVARYDINIVIKQFYELFKK